MALDEFIDSPRTGGPPLSLLQTKTFRSASGSSALKPLPSIIHFGGFEVGKTHTIILKLLNSGADRTRVNIIPPTTEFFKASYQKREALIPGTAEEVQILFTPSEYRYYYDCIRVHGQNDENILVPIHAYPVVGEVQLPSLVDMGTCPLAETKVKKFSLSCSVPIDFEFSVNVVTPHPFFAVVPEHGTIPAKGTTEVCVAFTPQNYTTSTMVFELLLSQFNAKPIRCTVHGTSAAGLHKRTEIEAQREPTPPKTTKKAKPPKSLQATNKPSEATKPKAQSIDGLVIPSALATVHHINSVLTQPALEGLNAQVRLNDRKSVTVPREQLLEAFLDHLKELSKRQGKGDSDLSNDERREILSERRDAEAEYTAAQGLGSIIEATALARRTTDVELAPSRTFRRLDGPQTVIPATLTFVPDASTEWQRRTELLQRFISAARTVIIRIRGNRRLSQLNSILHKVPLKAQPSVKMISTLNQKPQLPGSQDVLPALAQMILPFEFPVFSPPSVIQVSTPRTAVPARLSTIPNAPASFISLEVPQQYKLLGYGEVNFLAVNFVCSATDFDISRSKVVTATEHQSEPLKNALSLSIPDIPVKTGSIFAPLPSAMPCSGQLVVTEISAERFLLPWNAPRSTLSIDAVAELNPSANMPCASNVSLPLLPGISHAWVPRWASNFGDMILDGVPALADKLVIEGLDETGDVVNPGVLTMQTAISLFPAIPPRAEMPSSLPTSNNPVDSGALLEECIVTVDAYITQGQDGFASQLQAKFQQQLLSLQSEDLRNKLSSEFTSK